MTPEEELREQRQALNAAINNRDLETAKSFLDSAFIANWGRGGTWDKQTMLRQTERNFTTFKDFDSQIEVEHVEVSGDSAKLRVRRMERGRAYDPKDAFWSPSAIAKTFWVPAAIAAVWLGLTFLNPRRELTLENFAVPVVGSLAMFWVTFLHSRRSFNQTYRAQETWRSVEGRWLLIEELYLWPAGAGREYKSEVMLLGLPLIHVASGSGHRRRVAKGWIALGDTACGVLFAAGGIAVGGIAVGGLSVGILSLAGLALGVFAFGGGAVGVWAVGGLALGVFAIGGAAIAWRAAAGGLAVAHEFAVGGGAFATHANDAVVKRYMEGSAFFSAGGASMPYLQWLNRWSWVLVLLALLIWTIWFTWRAQRWAEPSASADGGRDPGSS